VVKQKIEFIKVKDLILWTENPRDPINPEASDQDIVDLALNEHSSKWNLQKLAKEMGSHYDFSELPTVVFHEKKPIVYDGNRRIILGKIKHQYVSTNGAKKIDILEFPEEIPCNVCSKEVGLKNIYRKHAESGSWQALERDIFLHKHMNEEKSNFLIIEESTGIISLNKSMNQGFVKKELFNDDALKKIGFEIKKGVLTSKHSQDQAQNILMDVAQKVNKKKINTRHSRGKILSVLDPDSKEIISLNKRKPLKSVNIAVTVIAKKTQEKNEPKKQIQSRRTKNSKNDLFGGIIYLKHGVVSDLYRDITDLYNYSLKEKGSLSNSFPSLIRMSLRLLCEAAAIDSNKDMDKYIKSHFANAKTSLDKDVKTTLSSHNINEGSIRQLLHIGAHNYTASKNIEITIAISIILGGMLSISHGKENST